MSLPLRFQFPSHPNKRKKPTESPSSLKIAPRDFIVPKTVSSDGHYQPAAFLSCIFVQADHQIKIWNCCHQTLVPRTGETPAEAPLRIAGVVSGRGQMGRTRHQIFGFVLYLLVMNPITIVKLRYHDDTHLQILLYIHDFYLDQYNVLVR